MNELEVQEEPPKASETMQDTVDEARSAFYRSQDGKPIARFMTAVNMYLNVLADGDKVSDKLKDLLGVDDIDALKKELVAVILQTRDGCIEQTYQMRAAIEQLKVENEEFADEVSDLVFEKEYLEDECADLAAQLEELKDANT